MNAQSKKRATKTNRTTKAQPKVLNKKNWKAERLPYQKDFPVRGFLQMCADRRFHNLIQKEFKRDAGLSSREDYWIHADAGGTPKMADLTIAPDYCYGKKEVRLMGWAAHGDICGGFGDDVGDDEIMQALCKTMQQKVRDYPLATHFIYFVTVQKKRGKEETIISRLRAEPGEDIACTAD